MLNLVLAVVGMATYEGPLANIGLTLSAQAANPVPLIALSVLVGFCVLRERTPHARLLTLLSLIAGVLAVLFGIGLALLALAADRIPVGLGARGRCDAGDLRDCGGIADQALPTSGRAAPASGGNWAAAVPGIVVGSTAPRPKAATDLAAGHGGGCGVAYRGRSSGWCPCGWLGRRRNFSGLAADSDTTEWAPAPGQKWATAPGQRRRGSVPAIEGTARRATASGGLVGPPAVLEKPPQSRTCPQYQETT